MHWKAAEWVHSHGMAKYFQMDMSGTLTVNDHGLFLIYAQVNIIMQFSLIKLNILWYVSRSCIATIMT